MFHHMTLQSVYLYVCGEQKLQSTVNAFVAGSLFFCVHCVKGFEPLSSTVEFSLQHNIRFLDLSVLGQWAQSKQAALKVQFSALRAYKKEHCALFFVKRSLEVVCSLGGSKASKASGMFGGSGLSEARHSLVTEGLHQKRKPAPRLSDQRKLWEWQKKRSQFKEGWAAVWHQGCVHGLSAPNKLLRLWLNWALAVCHFCMLPLWTTKHPIIYLKIYFLCVVVTERKLVVLQVVHLKPSKPFNAVLPAAVSE